MLKKRLRAWGLSKNLTAEDAEDMLEAQNRMDTSGRQAILLLRGHVQTIKRVQAYRRRKAKNNNTKPQVDRSRNEQRPSSVIALSHHPLMRPEPALRMLEKLEPVLREVYQLLRGGKDSGLCVSAMTSLHWTTSSTETILLERQFQSSILEGTRAFEENNIRWAGMCWQLALLQLEDLLWQPDLDIWTTFLRCCIRLHRSGAHKVGQYLHHKLRSIRDLLPSTAPHRALLFALTDASFDEVTQGGVFILEAKLHQIEVFWPRTRHAHITYQLNLAEERFYHGYLDRQAEIPKDDVFISAKVEDTCEDVDVVISHISKHMILFDYQKAETLARRCIMELDKYCKGENADLLLLMPLASLYRQLGNAQYYQMHDKQARSSYVNSLHVAEAFSTRFAEHAIEPTEMHRIFTLLSWLDTTQTSMGEETTEGYDNMKRALEMKMQAEVKARENRPWVPQIPDVVSSQAKHEDHQKLNIRTRAARTVTLSIPDLDKEHGLSKKRLEKGSVAGDTQKSTSSQAVRRSYFRLGPRPPPNPSRPVIPWS